MAKTKKPQRMEILIQKIVFYTSDGEMDGETLAELGNDIEDEAEMGLQAVGERIVEKFGKDTLSFKIEGGF